MRFLAGVSLVCFMLAGCGGSAKEPSATHQARSETRPASAARGPVVLGAKTFVVWGGIGFGTAHPTTLVVGSDPSVKITRIRWHGWGGPNGSGVGRLAVPAYPPGRAHRRE